MTAEEKLQHFYEVSMETAKEEAVKAIDDYRNALETEFDRHRQEKQESSENQFKIGSENAEREINKALMAEHLHIKRRLSHKQQKLKEKLFAEVLDSLKAFTKSPEYPEWLEIKIKEVLNIAQGNEAQIYLTSTDEALKEEIQNRTGILPLISETPFIGGVRAVIPEKNILIDYTFLTSFENEKENFNFDGGLRNE